MNFPSLAHRKFLSDKVRNDKQKTLNLTLLNNEERFQYHAYDYAWLDVVFNDHSHTSPIDPNGKWRNAALISAAEAMWRGEGILDEATAWEAASRWFSQNESGQSVVVRKNGRDYRFMRTAERSIILEQSTGQRSESERERIAAAYRLAMAKGNPLPAGLKADDPLVLQAVADLDQLRCEQKAALHKIPGPQATEQEVERWAAKISNIARANMRAFAKQGRVAVNKDRPASAYVIDGDAARDAALAAVQRDLGLSATPSVEQDRNEALQKMERE